MFGGCIVEGFLTTKETKFIKENFRFTEEISTFREGQIRTDQLLIKQNLIDYITWYKSYIQAPNHFVSASQIVKRYGFLLCIPSLAAMTLFSKRLNVAPNNCHIEPEIQGEHWLPRLRLEKQIAQENQFKTRKEWVEFCLRHIFREHLTKVIGLTSETFNIPQQILWENVAIYVFWLYENALKQTKEIKDSVIEEDFRLILNAPGEVFGTSQNPLSPFFTSKTIDDENEIRFRQTCCFAYELPNLGFCQTCPKIKHQ